MEGCLYKHQNYILPKQIPIGSYWFVVFAIDFKTDCERKWGYTLINDSEYPWPTTKALTHTRAKRVASGLNDGLEDGDLAVGVAAFADTPRRERHGHGEKMGRWSYVPSCVGEK